MIKFVKLLNQYRTIVLLSLCAPLLSILVLGRFKLELIPPIPYTRYQVRFEVPHRMATEITQRVTEPTEKIFNGLTGLLSMDSETQDEGAVIKLTFREELKPDNIYLFLQEKLDRIKLTLSSDVTSIHVSKMDDGTPAHLGLRFSEPVSTQMIRTTLGPYLSALDHSQPELDEKVRVTIAPIPEKLAQFSLSLSQVVQALKLSGFAAVLGDQGGISFKVGDPFTSIESVKALLVGSLNNRPIKLTDVAQLDIKRPDMVTNLSLWLDRSRVKESDIVETVEKAFPNIEISRLNRDAVLYEMIQPVLSLIMLLVFQIFLFRAIFGMVQWPLLFAFDGVITVHFLFWKGIVVGHLNVLDLHALILTWLIGTMFWVLFFSRIRTYFLPEGRLKKIAQSVEQATLFSIGELYPTFILLSAILILATIPILQTAANVTSRYILNTFFSVGLPVLLILLIFIPTAVEMKWVKRAMKTPKYLVDWDLPSAVSSWGMGAVLLCAMLLPVTFKNFPVTIFSQKNDKLAEFRGYGEKLVYLSELDVGSGGVANKTSQVESVRTNRSSTYSLWNFSSSGMRFLNTLDLPSFIKGAQEVSRSENWGFLRDGREIIPLVFDGSLINIADVGDLYLPARSSGKTGKPVHVLADQELVNFPSLVLRNRMRVADYVTLSGTSSLRDPPPSGVVPSQWTAFILEQWNLYSSKHRLSIILIFLVISLYLNSFVRSFLLLIFGLAGASVYLYVRSLFSDGFHSDSLWLTYLVPWLTLVIVTTISRIVDMERNRGHDRDDSLEDARLQFAPSVYYSALFLTASIGMLSVMERLSPLPSFGVWREGGTVAVTLLFFTWFSYRFFFPLFYLSSEEFIDRLALRAYTLLMMRKKLKRRKRT